MVLIDTAYAAYNFLQCTYSVCNKQFSKEKLWNNLNTMCSFTTKNTKPQMSKMCKNNRTFTDPKEACNKKFSLQPHTGQLFTEYLAPLTKKQHVL